MLRVRRHALALSQRSISVHLGALPALVPGALSQRSILALSQRTSFWRSRSAPCRHILALSQRPQSGALAALSLPLSQRSMWRSRSAASRRSPSAQALSQRFCIHWGALSAPRRSRSAQALSQRFSGRWGALSARVWRSHSATRTQKPYKPSAPNSNPLPEHP